MLQLVKDDVQTVSQDTGEEYMFSRIRLILVSRFPDLLLTKSRTSFFLLPGRVNQPLFSLDVTSR